ncbi:MAG: slipin family protein [Treponema sp.]|jgi:regulator of protease activity HflC (stomatin/prohibitin superfamily)|nr:slipin family protein [Treponema sp.]
MKEAHKTAAAPGAGLASEKPPLVKQRPPSPRRDYTLPALRLIILALAGASLWALQRPLAGWAPPEARWGLGIAVFLLVLLLSLSIRTMDEWNRGIILRFGRFRKVREPGLFFLLPLADRVARTVDIRIRVTDFSAQETLTRESVTVTVDALCFWLVWDPQKAALELENYEEAVALTSKTALRNSVSSHDLSTFLERGDLIKKQLQEEVDQKTTDWGITVQYIEITDIQIPEPLQDSLSRVAQAEREKKGRILLAEAEIEIAKKLEEAVAIYATNEPAMKLKILSILNEGLKAGNSMMLVPNSIAEELKTRDVFGLEALTELRQKEHDREET